MSFKALTLLFAAAMLAACTSATAAPARPAEPSTGSVPHLLRSVDLRLPVADYLPTATQNDRLGEARLHLIKKCLAGFGIDYPVTFTPGSAYGPRSDTDRRYGITDAALAKTDGYGLGARDPARVGKPPQPDIGDDGVTALTGSGRSQVRGKDVPPGGCMGQADAEIAKAVPSGVELKKAMQMQLWSFDKSKRDDRVVATFRQWSACMAKAGYRYTDPLAVMADPAFDGGTPSASEIHVALTDIGCKDEANVVGVWFTVESAYQKRQIAADSADFAAIRSAIAARDKLVSGLL